MKIAFPSNDGKIVDEHFGHCTQFIIVETENNTETRRSAVPAPEHVPGAFPAFLAEQKADVIITGGMGARAVQMFKDYGVDVILGASGSIDETLKVYFDGNLASSGSVCTEHERGCH